MFFNANQFGFRPQGGKPQNPAGPNNEGQKGKKQDFKIAIGPAYREQIQDIINTLQIKLLENPQTAKFNIINLTHEYKNNTDFNYFTLFVKDQNMFRALLKLSPLDFRNSKIILSPSVHPYEGKYLTFINKIFPDCVTKNFLDLSNIGTKSSQYDSYGEKISSIDINNEYAGLEFLLFLSTLKCYDMQCDIEQVAFDNNSLRRAEDLEFFPKLFPYLKYLSVSGSDFLYQPEQKKGLQKQNPNQKPRNPEEQLTIALAKLSQEYHIHYDLEKPLNKSYFTGEHKIKRAKYVPQPPPPRVTQTLQGVMIPKPDWIEEQSMTNFDFKQIDIWAFEFPTNEFISSFFEMSKESIPKTSPFYHSDVVFSISVDTCPPNSPMSFFSQFSANRSSSKTFEFPQVCGKDYVLEALEDVFGDNFNAVITEINNQKFNNTSMFSVIIHGFFCSSILDQQIFGFDRSFVIKDEGPLPASTPAYAKYSILNDHIFIRNSRSIYQ